MILNKFKLPNKPSTGVKGHALEILESLQTFAKRLRSRGWNNHFIRFCRSNDTVINSHHTMNTGYNLELLINRILHQFSQCCT